MTKKQRRAAIEVLLCASDPGSIIGIVDERNGGLDYVDYVTRVSLHAERVTIELAMSDDVDGYTMTCLELAQRIADKEWP